MGPFEWFREHIGKRVVVEIDGLRTQSWCVHLAGAEVAVLARPSQSTHLEQLAVFYRGIRRYLDPAAKEDVVGGRWDAQAGEWRPVRRAELGRKRAPPEIPDHLPDDLA